MSMFKRLLLHCILFSLLSITVNAQVYFGVSGGYGLGFQKRLIVSDFMSNSSGYFVFGGIEGSLGRGISFGMNSGYRFSKHLSCEIGFEKLISAEFNSTLKDITTFQTPGDPYTIYRTVRANMNSISPSFRVEVGNGKFRSYLRTGILIGLGGKVISERKTEEPNSPSQNSEYVECFRGGIAWGISCAIGANYLLNQHLHLFAETSVHAQEWSPRSSYYMEYKENDVDRLSTLTVSQKKFEYQKNVAYNFSGADSNIPTIRQQMIFPFSSIGIRLGVTYNF